VRPSYRRVRIAIAALGATALLGACVDPPPQRGDAPREPQASTSPAPAPVVTTPVRVAGAGDDCSLEAVAAASATLTALRAQLEDAEKLASVTSRIVLAGPVEKLQLLHRTIASVEVPPCMRRARHLLASQAESNATAYLSFMAGSSSEPAAAVARAAAQQYAARFSSAMQEVSECAPACPQLLAWTEASEAPLDAAGVAQSPQLPSGGQQPQTGGMLERLTTATRITESNATWARFAWQASFRNTSDVPARFNITIEFIDSDGFTIDTDTAYGAVVPPQSERTFSGDTLISMPGARRVASTRTKVLLS
jgi:hypothetical protein